MDDLSRLLGWAFGRLVGKKEEETVALDRTALTRNRAGSGRDDRHPAGAHRPAGKPQRGTPRAVGGTVVTHPLWLQNNKGRGPRGAGLLSLKRCGKKSPSGLPPISPQGRRDREAGHAEESRLLVLGGR